jgi:multiple sugar transport system substrate-binding protein
VTIDQPQHAQVLEEFLKTYSTYRFVAPDTINHSFTEMYQVIEGGRAGMFRVGDWNVRKWDQPSRAQRRLRLRAVAEVLRRARERGRHRRHARRRDPGELAEQAARDRVRAVHAGQGRAAGLAGDGGRGGAQGPRRRQLSERLAVVRRAQGGSSPTTSRSRSIAWYPELEAAFHRKLLAGITNPPADWKPFIAETAREMRDSWRSWRSDAAGRHGGNDRPPPPPLPSRSSTALAQAWQHRIFYLFVLPFAR